jgi:hypothetical protein
MHTRRKRQLTVRSSAVAALTTPYSPDGETLPPRLSLIAVSNGPTTADGMALSAKRARAVVGTVSVLFAVPDRNTLARAAGDLHRNAAGTVGQSCPGGERAPPCDGVKHHELPGNGDAAHPAMLRGSDERTVTQRVSSAVRAGPGARSSVLDARRVRCRADTRTFSVLFFPLQGKDRDREAKPRRAFDGTA